MNICRSIKFSQYLYNAPILGSASSQTKKKEIEKQRKPNLKYYHEKKLVIHQLLQEDLQDDVKQKNV